jgi:hypothetical protein
LRSWDARARGSGRSISFLPVIDVLRALPASGVTLAGPGVSWPVARQPSEQDYGQMIVRRRKFKFLGISLTGLSITVLALALAAGSCGRDQPTSPAPPANRDPVISSMWAFPNDVGATDSMIIVCEADDADGDTLVYDWFTDGNFWIQGAHLDSASLYNTVSNSHVFYRWYPRPSDTSAYVYCDVRDRKGGFTEKRTFVRLHW